ncbi:MAG: hypothetical protein FJ279_24235 [Planctomycetes bacterium]|nr:hypothetical protein [Planctomycetota bacterium]
MDQQPAFLGQFALSAATKLIFRLSGMGAWYMGRLLNLSPDQVAGLRDLETGQCLTVFSDERCSAPFVQRFPIAPDVRHLSRAELEELSARSLEPWMTHVVPEPAAPQKTPKPEERPPLLEGLPLLVFKRIAGHGPETIEERCQALAGLDRNRDWAARQELQKLGLIQEADTFGHHRLLVHLSDKGRAFAQELGISCHKYKSGPVHEWVLNQVIRHLGRACPGVRFVRKDTHLADRQPDAILMLPGNQGYRIAIQVVCSPNYSRESQALVDIVSIREVDGALVFTAKAAHRKSLERALETATADQTISAKIRLFDIEPCLQPGFNWGSLLEPLWPRGQKE